MLSGGGGSGMAHVGVLKALEEEGIMIDYIAGTSMGACVGGLYAAGYSPEQIEQIALTDEFQKWAKGSISEDKTYYFKKYRPTPSMISLNFDLDSLEYNLPTNLINSATIDFSLMELLATANGAADSNFDSLMIPFRCVAADISNREEVVFDCGNLATSIRASMAYPFYLNPIKMDGNLLFDGGLYNNFPADVMCREFAPDVLIGSNVSSNFQAPSEDNILSQLKSMLSKDTKYKIPCGKGVIIEPHIPDDIGVFDFRSNKAIIDSGYVEAMRMMDSLLLLIKDVDTSGRMSKKRSEFNSRKVPLIFGNTEINGLHPRQTKFLISRIRNAEGTFDQEDLQEIYLELIADSKIKSIYPTATYNKSNGNFDLKLDVKEEKDFTASFGGLISTQAISTGFFELKYDALGATGFSASGNIFFGKLYNSGNVNLRWDVPFSVPFYLESNWTINHFDYFESFTTFVEEIKPSYLIFSEKYGDLSISLPVFNKGKMSAGATLFDQDFEYYQTKDFERNDTADVTHFDGSSAFIKYDRNSLNRKMYPTKGSRFQLSYRSTSGKEKTIPGSTAATDDIFLKNHSFFSLKLKWENYFFKRSSIRLGYMLEGMFSDQSYFGNYTATVLSAPAFFAIPEAKTHFMGRYRAMKYVASGVKLIYCVSPKLDIRAEGYIFQPYEVLLQTNEQKADEGKKFRRRDYVFSFAPVYNTAIGPLALNVNYYENTENPLSILLHFGYILFNKKALE